MNSYSQSALLRAAAVFPFTSLVFVLASRHGINNSPRSARANEALFIIYVAECVQRLHEHVDHGWPGGEPPMNGSLPKVVYLIAR